MHFSVIFNKRTDKKWNKNIYRFLCHAGKVTKGYISSFPKYLNGWIYTKFRLWVCLLHLINQVWECFWQLVFSFDSVRKQS